MTIENQNLEFVSSFNDDSTRLESISFSSFGEEPALAGGCLGTAGCYGSLGSATGTAGTFGSLGCYGCLTGAMDTI
jgi:hypothetical protein